MHKHNKNCFIKNNHVNIITIKLRMNEILPIYMFVTGLFAIHLANAGLDSTRVLSAFSFGNVSISPNMPSTKAMCKSASVNYKETNTRKILV